MGVRMERYKEKKTKKLSKLRRSLKTFIILSMFLGLVCSIIFVNNTIKDFNYGENTVLLSIDFENRIFTFLGKSYIIELDKAIKLIRPD